MEGGFLDPKKSKGPDWTRLGGAAKNSNKSGGWKYSCGNGGRSCHVIRLPAVCSHQKEVFQKTVSAWGAEGRQLGGILRSEAKKV